MSDEQNQKGQQGDEHKDPLAEALKKAQENEEIKKQENGELEKIKEELQQMTEVAQRTMADLANYKRRTEEERTQMVQFANADLMRSIIPVVDNLKRAMEHMPKELENEAESWAEGIVQTFKHLQEALKNHGLEEIKCVGETFDPNLHEAVLQGPGEKDIITEEMEGGYMLGNKVIRHAKVKVGHGEQ